MYRRQRKDTKMQKMVLPSGWDNTPISPLPNRRARRPKNRKIRAVIIAGAVLLVLVLTGGFPRPLFYFNPSLLSKVPPPRPPIKTHKPHKSRAPTNDQE